MKTIIETAEDAGTFITLLSALNSASLTEALRGPGPYTVFAPSNAAFKKLPAGALESLLRNTNQLKSVLNYHVVSGKMAAKDIKSRDVKTLEGSPVATAVNGSAITVNGAKVEKADLAASNGIIHTIDTVLMPKGIELPAAA